VAVLLSPERGKMDDFRVVANGIASPMQRKHICRFAALLSI